MKNRHMSKKIDIIGLYLGDYKKTMSGREIARKMSINHQTALNCLNELVKDRALIYQTKGRNKEYSLNLISLKSKKMVEIAENAKAIDLINHKEIGVIIQEIAEYAESIIIFGSFASGSYNSKSDLDIMAIGKADKEKINKIKKRYVREVNVEYASLKKFEKALISKKSLAIEILKNHVILGNVSAIVDIFWRWHKR